MLDFPFEIIDLTHTLMPNIPTWDVSCGFYHNLKYDYDMEAEFKFKTHQINMQEGIGTHMDSPAHCFPGMQTIDQIDLNDLIAPCYVIDISSIANKDYALSVSDIKDFEAKYESIKPNSFVMVYTGWDKYWNDAAKYRNNHEFPSISKEAAEYLLSLNIKGIGIDTLSPDNPKNGFPVHNIMLGNNKYIFENVANLSSMPQVSSYILAAPMKIEGGTEAPIRLMGLVRK
ncbi:MAG: cyclase family protein [Alphaproteobacteria bacterium]|nr:cyclase family protein [Alphaproteobacteria bacterium]OJV13119.1 MAG: cyclase [Alphaproteobacteria bacterium 33-17]